MDCGQPDCLYFIPPGDQNSSEEAGRQQAELTSFFTLKVVLSVVVAGDYTGRHVSPADQ